MTLYLILSCASWLTYGLYCLTFPDTLGALAGLQAQSPTGAAELRAMYGGLQSAVGVIAALGAYRAPQRRPALLVLTVLYSGLFAGRLVGVIAGGDLSAYSMLGLAFEGGFGAWGWWLLRHARRDGVNQ